MSLNNFHMQIFHDKTKITKKNSFEQSSFIDWRTQAKNFKTYPKFFRRYKIDDYKELEFIKNFGKITDTKKYGQDEVNLRVNPSAGGLYPCEIYIQIRGIKGFLSGIYHYEPISSLLVLIHELSNDGIEFYLSNKDQQKFVFLISNAYFRSSWKYEKRSIRYLLLDTGHQIASIFAALKLASMPFNLEFDFDKHRLNEDFGFEGFEFLQAVITSQFYKEKEPKSLREKLVNVSACDYQIRNQFVDSFISFLENENSNLVAYPDFLEELQKIDLKEAIENRRSIRAFNKEPITKKEFEFITENIFEYSNNLGIEIFLIINKVQGLEKGSYKNVKLLKKGSFEKLSSKLAFNQKLAEDSCLTLFYSCKRDSNYIQNSILCGFLAHIISLRSTYLNIQNSGIGAFFDDLCEEFFETKNNILYLQVIGR